MKKYKKIFFIALFILICVLDAYHVFGLNTTTFTDGSSSGNFTYVSGTEQPNVTISLSQNSRVTNAILRLTGYGTNNFTGIFPNVNYSSYSTDGIGQVVNSTYFDDDDYSTFTEIAPLAGGGSQVNLYMNVTEQGNIATSNLSIKAQKQGNPSHLLS